jgi:phosphoribosyl 1,2-cyclic phosphodiesterase
MYNIIATGSTGNAVIYFKSILLDCGVSFASLKSFVSDIQIVFISHHHGDHFNTATLKRLQFERPSLRIASGEHMKEHLKGFRNVDILAPNVMYDYNEFAISPVILYHDVSNFGFRIYKNGKKIFHATDTNHLSGIEAKNYDIYAIEANYDEDTVWDKIQALESRGKFAHQRGSINSHLSEQAANDFFFKNKGENSILVRLHKSKTSL